MFDVSENSSYTCLCKAIWNAEDFLLANMFLRKPGLSSRVAHQSKAKLNWQGVTFDFDCEHLCQFCSIDHKSSGPLEKQYTY